MMIESQKPYLIRALYEWCVKEGFTPYIAVVINSSVKLPQSFLDNKEESIILNLDENACEDLVIGNEQVVFKASFGGVKHDVAFPIENVIAIFNKEQGQGMQFLDENEQEALRRKGNTSPVELKIVK